MKAFEPTYPVETERLLLRPFQASDFDALFAIHSRPDVARYLYSEPRTVTEARALLERKIGSRAIRSEGDSRPWPGYARTRRRSSPMR